MPDFEEGRTEMVEDNQWPDMLIALTEVFANTPAALLLLQRFAWQRLPGGAPSYNGRAYLRLYADDLDELKHSATAERLTWQAAPKAKPKE